MKKIERKKFVLKNINNYSYKFDENLEFMINMYINEIRNKYYLPDLIINKNISLPDFIINEPFDLIFNSEKNVFELSKNVFLIKYKNIKDKDECNFGDIPIKEFNDYFANNQTILNIIKNKELNEILAINQDNIYFFLIYESCSYKNKNNQIYNNEKFIFKNVYENEHNLFIIEEKNDIKKIDKELPLSNLLD